VAVVIHVKWLNCVILGGASSVCLHEAAVGKIIIIWLCICLSGSGSPYNVSCYRVHLLGSLETATMYTCPILQETLGLRSP
jgi:hypothetical protein